MRIWGSRTTCNRQLADVSKTAGPERMTRHSDSASAESDQCGYRYYELTPCTRPTASELSASSIWHGPTEAADRRTDELSRGPIVPIRCLTLALAARAAAAFPYVWRSDTGRRANTRPMIEVKPVWRRPGSSAKLRWKSVIYFYPACCVQARSPPDQAAG